MVKMEKKVLITIKNKQLQSKFVVANNDAILLL